MKWPQIILAKICLCFSLSLWSTEADKVVEASHTQITFSPATGGIVRIANTRTGHNFISTATENPRLWRLALRKTNGEPAELASRSSGKPEFRFAKGSAELVWKNLNVAGVNGSLEVRVSCRIQPSDGLAHFRIEALNRSDASIMTAVFPEVDGLGVSGKSDVAFPKYNWGEMFRGLKDKLHGYYPSADMPMQFCALTEETNSMYLATHDPGALFKTFLVHPGKVFSVETSVPNATVPGNSWQQPFDLILGVYEGDWVTSCKLYRKWALKSAPWTARGPLSKRKDVSPAAREIGVWLNVSGSFADNAKSALAFRQQMGVPIGVQWYNWHSNPFDKDYPDYLPPKPGFSEAVKQLQAAGVYSMPYMNGRLWDTQNRNYGAARPYASMNQKGEPNLEDYQSGTKLAVMCLGCPFWQTNLAQLVDRIADTTGVNGIYIDQVAGAPIAECYDRAHGHTLGRDRWWIDGYRKSIGAARAHAAKKPGGFFVAAENNAEPYMDFVDLFLIWIPRSENDIPMMTMVYSGYAQYFGTNRGSDSDTSFSMLQARDFTWGAQLFWESPFILAPEQKEKLKILTNLSQLRYKARKYLVEGELLNSIQPLNDVPKLTGRWGSWTSTLENRTIPSVHATLWKGSDDSYGVVIANADSSDRQFKFAFTPGAAAGKKWRIQKITTSGSENMTSAGNDPGHISVTVPARDGLVLQFK